MTDLFHTEHHVACTQTLVAWHAALQHQGRDRAALRRAHEGETAYYVGASWDLVRKLEGVAEIPGYARHHLPAAAALLARFHTHTEARSMGVHLAPVSDLRFRRLIKCRDREELYTALVRMTPLLKGQVDFYRLVRDYCCWNARVRKDWAEHYYTTNSEMPRSHS